MYIRVYNIAPEYEDGEEHPCFNVIHVTKLKGDVKLRVTNEKMKVPLFIKKIEAIQESSRDKSYI